MVNVSSSPLSLRSLGTRHEYPQVLSQPKGIEPSAMVLPLARLMATFGSNCLSLSYGAEHDVQRGICQDGLDGQLVTEADTMALHRQSEQDLRLA